MMMIASDLTLVESHFAFGKNWLDYARKIDEPRIAQAIADLQRLSGMQRLDGLSFLDIGCGSGLHSLAAIKLGARKVVGVDIDADSVAASQQTLTSFAPDADACFHLESIFGMQTETYGDFDLVYSWGVLHHTGDMYSALSVAASLVRPGGMFMVALYRKTPFCGMWRVIKRWYSSAPPSRQKAARSLRTFLHRLSFLVRGRSFKQFVDDYRQSRGMDYYNDVHDWMGGFPYESISPDECRNFFEKLGFQREQEFARKPDRILTGMMGSGCDEYAFRRLR